VGAPDSGGDARASLPRDADSILKLAARSMFDLFSNMAEGMLLVDRTGRVVWINDAYKRFLPALGFARAEDFVGKPVEEVVPNTLMRHVLETGKPILIDLLTNRAGTFVVSRIPLRDAAGEVTGVLGMVLFDHPETTLQPLIAKFARLQKDLDEAKRELAAQRRTKYTFASFIGSSPAALEVKRQARRAAQTGASVLLLGETGTGKELLAHAMHAGSERANKPFIGVNLAAVPETLLEAEFFGVAPGAYTGAERKGRDGRFKLADGGTLFLDEVGDMPLGLQAKLLRALQEQEIEPLGSNRVIKVDVRVIAATSRDLKALVSEGRFRGDLFYRLNVLPVRLPALRERLTDLEALAESLLESIAVRTGMPQRELAPSALAALAAHPWPGNVRELRNTLEQAAMLTDNARLTAEDFASILPAATPETLKAAQLRPLPQLIAELERSSIQSALAATGGNKVSAARMLGISRATLYEKLAGVKQCLKSGQPV
jgi:transcriptional regulator with PAS, ATPase and Fis domain